MVASTEYVCVSRVKTQVSKKGETVYNECSHNADAAQPQKGAVLNRTLKKRLKWCFM